MNTKYVCIIFVYEIFNALPRALLHRAYFEILQSLIAAALFEVFPCHAQFL